MNVHTFGHVLNHALQVGDRPLLHKVLWVSLDQYGNVASAIDTINKQINDHINMGVHVLNVSSIKYIDAPGQQGISVTVSYLGNSPNDVEFE